MTVTSKPWALAPEWTLRPSGFLGGGKQSAKASAPSAPLGRGGAQSKERHGISSVTKRNKEFIYIYTVYRRSPVE